MSLRVLRSVRRTPSRFSIAARRLLTTGRDRPNSRDAAVREPLRAMALINCISLTDNNSIVDLGSHSFC